MLRVQTDRCLAGFQHVHQQELQQEALTHAGVAQDEDAAVGLVLGAALQIHDDVGAVAVLPDVEALGIGLAGVIEGVEIGYRGGRKYPLILTAEAVPASRVDRPEALLLAQENAVGGELGAHQCCQDLVLQGEQSLLIPRRQLQEHGTVHQRFPVPVHGGDERRHVLQIGLRCDGGFEIRGAGSAHAVLVGGVVKDLALLRRGHLAGVDGERDAALGSQVLEKRQFFGAGGIPPQGEGRAVGIAQDVMVGIEFHRSGRDDIQEVLG